MTKRPRPPLSVLSLRSWRRRGQFHWFRCAFYHYPGYLSWKLYFSTDVAMFGLAVVEVTVHGDCSRALAADALREGRAHLRAGRSVKIRQEPIAEDC